MERRDPRGWICPSSHSSVLAKGCFHIGDSIRNDYVRYRAGQRSTTVRKLYKWDILAAKIARFHWAHSTYGNVCIFRSSGSAPSYVLVSTAPQVADNSRQPS
jgi:hypothetical protein